MSEYNRWKGTTVKIDSSITASGAAGTTASGVGESRSRNVTSLAQGGSATEVHFSELATQLQTPTDATAFDEARVNEIKQAITEGRFKINPEAIADRLLASASELVAAQPKA